MLTMNNGLFARRSAFLLWFGLWLYVFAPERERELHQIARKFGGKIGQQTQKSNEWVSRCRHFEAIPGESMKPFFKRVHTGSAVGALATFGFGLAEK